MHFSVLGLFITYLPFFHFLISFNYPFTTADIFNYIRCLTISFLLISTIIFIENLVSNVSLDGDGMINSKIFGMGFYASFCNQLLVLTIGKFIYSKKKVYICLATSLLFIVLLSIQLKAIIGAMVVLLGYVFMRVRSGFVKFVIPAIIISIALIITLNTPKLQEKITKYQELYLSEDAVNGVARTALYYTSFQIACDFFPFGTGQGTFGSVPSKITSDAVYRDYGINKIYGLDGESPDFRLDTHWAYILGENGLLGLLIYLWLLFYPIRAVSKLNTITPENRMYKFIVTMSVLTMFIESLALPLPNRLSMIFIYSGLSGIILRRLNEQVACSK